MDPSAGLQRSDLVFALVAFTTLYRLDTSISASVPTSASNVFVVSKTNVRPVHKVREAFLHLYIKAEAQERSSNTGG